MLGRKGKMLGRWKRQAAPQTKGRCGSHRPRAADHAARLRWRQEVKRLCIEREMLKKAPAFFAQESRGDTPASPPPSRPGRSWGCGRDWELGAADVTTTQGVTEPLPAGRQSALCGSASWRLLTRRATVRGVVAWPNRGKRRGMQEGASRGVVCGTRSGARGQAAAVGVPTPPSVVLVTPWRQSCWRGTWMWQPPMGRGGATSPIAGPQQAGGRHPCWWPCMPARGWGGPA
jgi:hypothetical protein